MKKIIFFLDRYKPSSLATSTRFVPIIDELVKSGHWEVIIRTDKQSRDEEYVIPNFFSSPSNDLSFSKRALFELLLGFEWFLYVVFCKSDLIIFSSPPFLSSLIGTTGCWIFGKSYIVDIRDKYPDVYIVANLIKRNSLIHRVFYVLESNFYRRAKSVVTVTPFLVRAIEKRISSQKCFLVRNGFDAEVFKVNELKFDNFTVVFHGNLGRFQLPELVFDVAKRLEANLNKIDFIVIGDGTKADFFKCNKLKNLEFHGRLNNNEVASIVSRSHLGLSFRTKDEISVNSLPVRIFEYMGVGIPSIVVPSFSEGGMLVKSLGVGFAFDESQKDDIVNLIVDLALDRGLYKKMVLAVMNNRLDFTRQAAAIRFVSVVEGAIE